MDNSALITQFYNAFARGDYAAMTACYHPEIRFQDPAFGVLKGERAKKMWEMLLSSGTKVDISFSNVQSTVKTGSVKWVAAYTFGKKQRKVVNRINAQFRFKDGLIIEHTDTFSLWKWSRQALGLPGWLLGWTPFMRKKIQQTSNKQLDRFIEKASLSSL